MVKHGGTAGEGDVFVEPSADVDWGGLDNTVDDFRQRGEEIGGEDFGVEEDFWGQEPLVAYIYSIFLWDVSVREREDT